MKKFYSGMELRRRLDALNAKDSHAQGGENEKVSIKEAFTEKRIRGSAWVGFWMATFQQLTGINAVLFYSAQLFGSTDGSGLTPNQASVVINWSNFVATIGGTILLGYLGRKTLMIGSQLFCIIGSLGMFLFTQVYPSQSMSMVLTVTFIFAFEFGPGPIVWLYISEICNDSATSVNTVVNWLWTLAMSISTLFIFNAI